MQDQEAVDLTARQHWVVCHGTVYRFDVLLNAVEHLRVTGQLLVRRIGDVVTFCPVAHRRQVDVDEGHTAILAVAKQNSLKNVGIKLQFVLNILRRKHRTIGHFANVLGAVDNTQVAAFLFEEARITGCDPTFRILSGGGAFRVVVVFHKRARTAVENLAVVSNFDFHIRAWHTHGIRAHFAIRLRRDEDGGFGLTIELLQIDAKRAVEFKDFRSNRFPGSVTHTHTAKTKRVFQRTVHQHVAHAILEVITQAAAIKVQQNRIFGFEMLPRLAAVTQFGESHADAVFHKGFHRKAQAHRITPAVFDPALHVRLGQTALGHAVFFTSGLGKVHKVMEQRVFQIAAVFHTDHHAGQRGFKNSRWREVVGWADFAQVSHHGLCRFWAVHAEAAPVRLTHREDEVPNPGHRQVRQDFFVAGQRVKVRRILGAFDHIAIGEHHTFGLAGCAGGIEHYAGAVVVQLFATRLQFANQLIMGGAALGLNVAELMQLAVIVLS
mmetsp:Transcript_13434/g.21383  ORF Transcript_13434/g.21383 Transcript_13434/m.21383 type:complete len:494 (+) Transcript_13434:1020-2501(+)